MNSTIIANEMHMTYDFYMKHNMEAIKWKLNSLMKQN